MTRQDEILKVLREIAPLVMEVSYEAQRETDALRDSDWGRRNLSRSASANQVVGTARRRIACDRLIERSPELDGQLVVTTSDSEQNQGQYYLRCIEPAFLVTIRRKAHKDDEQPEFLQLQLADMRELVELEEEVVVYLEVPPFGSEPCFEIATRGQETITYRLCDLVDGADEDGPGTTASLPGPRPTPPAPVVTSTRKSTQSDVDAGRG